MSKSSVYILFEVYGFGRMFVLDGLFCVYWMCTRLFGVSVMSVVYGCWFWKFYGCMLVSGVVLLLMVVLNKVS